MYDKDFNNDFNGEYHYSYHNSQNNQNNDPWNSQEERVIDLTQKKRKRRRGLKITAIVLACVIGAGAVFGAGYAVNTMVNTPKPEETNMLVSDREPVEVVPVKVTGSRELSYSELYATNVNSCVSINVTSTTNFFGQTTQSASSGSGFIITSDGYIVTNYHVISGGTTVKVTTYDGSTYDGTIIGGDEEYDVAVVKIEAEGLTPVVIGDSDSVQVGNDVAVIGNPLGELTFSMSEGIVSTTNRLINVDGTPFNMIQITAAVNSGNSGGPLFNMYGELVGIVSAKYSTSSSGTSVEGLGFAIPINDVSVMIQDIISDGYYTNKPYLALSGGTLQEGMVPDCPVTTGVFVFSVEAGGAAANAGLQVGDIIVKIGDTEIAAYEDIAALKKSYSAGDTVTVEFYRGSEKQTTELTFDQAPDTRETIAEEPQQDDSQHSHGGYDQFGGMNPWDFFEYYFGGMPGY